MALQNGFVTNIDIKPTKFGDKYQIHVNGKRLMVGQYPPKGISTGDYVQFDTEMKGQYENLVSGSLSKIDKPAGIEPPAPPAPSAISKDRQDVISAQSALNSAIALVHVLALADAIPVGKTATGKAKADKIEAIVDMYTERFYKQSTGAELDLGRDEPKVENAAAEPNWEE